MSKNQIWTFSQIIHKNRLKYIKYLKKVMEYIYNGILLSHKKEQYNAICSNISGLRDYHTEWGETKKDAYHISLVCELFLRRGTNEPIYKIVVELWM